MLGVLFNLAMVALIGYGIYKVFVPLFPGDADGAEYAGQLVGWCIAIVIFSALFGIL